MIKLGYASDRSCVEPLSILHLLIKSGPFLRYFDFWYVISDWQVDPISDEQSTMIMSASLASFDLISIPPPHSLYEFDAPSTTSTVWSPSPHQTSPPCPPHRTQPPPCHPRVCTGLQRRIRHCSIPMVSRSRRRQGWASCRHRGWTWIRRSQHDQGRAKAPSSGTALGSSQQALAKASGDAVVQDSHGFESDTSSRTELWCSGIRHKIMYSSLLVSEAAFFGVWRQG